MKVNNLLFLQDEQERLRQGDQSVLLEPPRLGADRNVQHIDIPSSPISNPFSDVPGFELHTDPEAMANDFSVPLEILEQIRQEEAFGLQDVVTDGGSGVNVQEIETEGGQGIEIEEFDVEKDMGPYMVLDDGTVLNHDSNTKNYIIVPSSTAIDLDNEILEPPCAATLVELDTEGNVHSAFTYQRPPVASAQFHDGMQVNSNVRFARANETVSIAQENVQPLRNNNMNRPTAVIKGTPRQRRILETPLNVQGLSGENRQESEGYPALKKGAFTNDGFEGSRASMSRYLQNHREPRAFSQHRPSLLHDQANDRRWQQVYPVSSCSREVHSEAKYSGHYEAPGTVGNATYSMDHYFTTPAARFPNWRGTSTGRSPLLDIQQRNSHWTTPNTARNVDKGKRPRKPRKKSTTYFRQDNAQEEGNKYNFKH